jgi:hypothetical protein
MLLNVTWSILQLIMIILPVQLRAKLNYRGINSNLQTIVPAAPRVALRLPESEEARRSQGDFRRDLLGLLS